MNKRNKIIIILLIIIIIPVAYYGVTILEEQIFYNSIKEISDIENQSDSIGDKIRNSTYPSNQEYQEYCVNNINTNNRELEMLQQLKGKVFTDKYKEFIDIQINRLNSENRTTTLMLNNSNLYQEFKSGTLGYSRALSLIKDNNLAIESYSNKTSEYKVEADSFLSVHTDMKDKLYELDIDEDFLYEQIEEVKIKNIT